MLCDCPSLADGGHVLQPLAHEHMPDKARRVCPQVLRNWLSTSKSPMAVGNQQTCSSLLMPAPLHPALLPLGPSYFADQQPGCVCHRRRGRLPPSADRRQPGAAGARHLLQASARVPCQRQRNSQGSYASHALCLSFAWVIQRCCQAALLPGLGLRPACTPNPLPFAYACCPGLQTDSGARCG